MTTISHVRGCKPSSMLDYATSLLASNSTFTDQIHRMDSAVDAAMDKWQGEAAAAASARSLSESLAASHIDTAVIAIADAPRETAAEAIAALKALGVRPVMLSGDSRATAERVAAQLGIDVRHPEV